MRSLLRGLRGFGKEFSRTGSLRAFVLQVRTGVAHLARLAAGRDAGDPIARFLANYGPDGVRLPDLELAAVQHAAQSCIACGLCSLECARVGGAPRHEAMDAVTSASRLVIDVVRLGSGLVQGPPASDPPCAGCAACDAVCPVAVPVSRIQVQLAHLETEAVRLRAPSAPAPRDVAAPMATAAGMR